MPYSNTQVFLPNISKKRVKRFEPLWFGLFIRIVLILSLEQTVNREKPLCVQSLYRKWKANDRDMLHNGIEGRDADGSSESDTAGHCCS